MRVKIQSKLHCQPEDEGYTLYGTVVKQDEDQYYIEWDNGNKSWVSKDEEGIEQVIEPRKLFY